MRRRQTPDHSSTVIISDLMHGSTDPDRIYPQMADLLVRAGVSRLIAIGPELKRHADCFTIPTTFYDSTDDFLNETTTRDFCKELILIKGAPGSDSAASANSSKPANTRPYSKLISTPWSTISTPSARASDRPQA